MARDKEQIAIAIAEIQAGQTLSGVARRYGIPKTTLHRHVHKIEIAGGTISAKQSEESRNVPPRSGMEQMELVAGTCSDEEEKSNTTRDIILFAVIFMAIGGGLTFVTEYCIRHLHSLLK